jgi:tetratricopeptide (TPR) repeat protein
MASSAVQARQPPANPAAAAALRAHGLELGYNLDHAEALATFKEAIAADPSHPAGYRLAAAAAWIMILFEQGAVTVDDYLGQARSDLSRPTPRADLHAAFQQYLRQAVTMADERVRANPADVDAHFQAGAAFGFLATYGATVEGRIVGNLGNARRAYREHERVLELDPRRKDAGLIVGMYRYAVAALSAPVRVVAHIAGFGGGKERGLRLVEEAARYPSDVQSNAMFTLVLMYNREERYDDALRMIAALQERYPRNRLLWLEAGNTALRAGRPAQARRSLEEGLARFSRDPRKKATGEEARWRYAYGAALVALKDVVPADRELRAALAGASRDWVRGRTRKELGKLADLAGNRQRALEEYHEAHRLCQADRDSDCSAESRTLIKDAYR